MNSNLLRGKIVERGYNIKTFSQKTGIKKTALYRKLKGKSEFDRREIEVISNVLQLNHNQICEIFFTAKVSKREQNRTM